MSQGIELSQEQALEVLLFQQAWKNACVSTDVCPDLGNLAFHSGAGIGLELAGAFGIAGEGSVKFVINNEGGPSITLGFDIGLIFTSGIGPGTPSGGLEAGITSQSGTIADATRPTTEVNVTLALGGGIAADIAFDSEQAALDFEDLIENGTEKDIFEFLTFSNANSFAGVDLAIAAASPGVSVIGTFDSTAIGLSGVHKNGKTESWPDILSRLIVRTRR